MVIKLFKKIVPSCWDCPNYNYCIDYNVGGLEQNWCKLSKKEIHPFNDIIPDWCLLEEYKEV